MIVDLQRFLAAEQPYWRELDAFLDRLERDPGLRLKLEEVQRFHYLYQRAASDLARLSGAGQEPEIRRRLESLVQRAYAEVYETRRGRRFRPLTWFRREFPRAFRRRARSFWLILAVMLCGFVFGGAAMVFDPSAKSILTPFAHLQGDPSDRVAEEEAGGRDDSEGSKTAFSTYLMTHNTRVTILALALGITFGLGTIIVIFYNGVVIGAVCLDYLRAGEGVFLAGWLLPHGSVEIPAILLGGQAGLVLAGALIGWGRPATLRQRLRAVSGDLTTLVFGAAVLLVWAGIVEAFFSQYHEPILPYSVKIAFGAAQLLVLFWFLTASGRRKEGRGADG